MSYVNVCRAINVQEAQTSPSGSLSGNGPCFPSFHSGYPSESNVGVEVEGGEHTFKFMTHKNVHSY